MTTLFSAPTELSCPTCAAGLEHCHGTAIIHAHGRLECTERPACPIAEESHAYVILCVELEGGCC